MLYRRRWTSRDELRIAIVISIQRTYHSCRQGAVVLTPIDYEMINTPLAAQAA